MLRVNADAGVFDLNYHAVRARISPENKCSPVGHRVDRVCCERNNRLLYLPWISSQAGQRLIDLFGDLDASASPLMRDELGRRLEDLCNVHLRALARANAAEIKKSGSDRFTAKGFAFDQREIFVEIAERFGLAESSLINALLKRLGAGGDRCKRVIDLVNYTRRQTSHGRQLLSSSNGVDRLNTHGNILANRDNVCYFTRYRVFHRNFAYNPMTRRTVVGDRLLFNAFQLAGFKNPLKFLPQSSFGKFCEHGEYIPADSRVARYALHTNFAVAIPRHDAIIAVDHVKRYRQRVENCLRKLSIFFFCLIDRVVKGRFKMG